MITITLLDEVNAHVAGLPKKHFKMIYESLKLPRAGAFMTVAYQMKMDDGMEPLMTPDGFTYAYFLDDIMDMLAELGYGEEDVEFVDEREYVFEYEPVLVDENYLAPVKFRTHQTDAINRVIVKKCGVLNLATNAGKSLICVALSKYFNEHGLTGLIIVPNVKLAKQTLQSYVDCGIQAAVVGTNIKTNADRLKMFSKSKNIIITSSLLNNLIKYVEDEGNPDFFNEISLMILYDEVHIFGETMFDAFKYNLTTAPIRIGMTGTVPKDKLKCAKIFGSLGGGELMKVSVKELQEKGYASNFQIDFVVLEDQAVDEFATKDMVRVNAWNWAKEERYYGMEKRAKPICDYISTLEPMNTLVLCRPELGQHIAKIFGTICINKDVPNETRDELFSKFAKKGTEIVVASFDTSATGISQNMIHRVILVDSGKDETNVLQGIGRGIRLDGEENKCHVVDISANTLYAVEHRKARQKIYKREKFVFSKQEVRISV
jgi:superfamily II DNA or RNA helicase